MSPQTVMLWLRFMNIRTTQSHPRMRLLMFLTQVFNSSFFTEVIIITLYGSNDLPFFSSSLGVDINCGSYMLRNTLSAIKQGKMKEEELDRALVNLFTVQLRLGLFDGDPRRGQFGNLGPQDVCTPQHKALALEAARQGIVLLKNDGKFLPLNKNVVNTLAVIGPFATTSELGGGYSGIEKWLWIFFCFFSF